MVKNQIIKITKNAKYGLKILGGIIISQDATHAKFEGFYVGGSLGYLQQNTSINAQQDPSDFRADMHKSTANNSSPVAELFLGWGKLFNSCFYGGVEGQMDVVIYSGKRLVEDTNFLHTSKRKSPGLVALLRLGYLINLNTMIYGGIGTKYVRFKNDFFEKAGYIHAPFQKSCLHFYAELGFEVSTLAFKDIALRFSYSYMPKRVMDIKSISFPANHVYHEKGSYHVGTSEQAIKIGLIYRF